MNLSNYIVTTGRKLARKLTAQPPVTHIPVRAGNMRTQHGWKIPVHVRVIKRIEVKYIP